MKKVQVIVLVLIITFVQGQELTSELNATHFWDCSGGACDSNTLQPWDYSLYRYPPQYAPLDPNDYGGSVMGESIWMTGAANDRLTSILGSNDGCCGTDPSGGGGCGKCILVQNPDAVNS